MGVRNEHDFHRGGETVPSPQREPRATRSTDRFQAIGACCEGPVRSGAVTGAVSAPLQRHDPIILCLTCFQESQNPGLSWRRWWLSTVALLQAEAGNLGTSAAPCSPHSGHNSHRVSRDGGAEYEHPLMPPTMLKVAANGPSQEPAPFLFVFTGVLQVMVCSIPPYLYVHITEFDELLWNETFSG